MPDELPAPHSEFLLYTTEDGRTRVECRFEKNSMKAPTGWNSWFEGRSSPSKGSPLSKTKPVYAQIPRRSR